MTHTETGDIRLMRPPHLRTAAAAILWVIAALCAQLWLNGKGGRATDIVAALAGAMLLAAVWTTWAREEWIAGRGRLVHRIRFGPWLRQRAFENGTLAITHTVSSEDDYLYRLVVRVPDRSRVFQSSVREERPLVESGEWLAAVTGFPFTRAG
jgi:hypothetical protein